MLNLYDEHTHETTVRKEELSIPQKTTIRPPPCYRKYMNNNEQSIAKRVEQILLSMDGGTNMNIKSHSRFMQ